MPLEWSNLTRLRDTQLRTRLTHGTSCRCYYIHVCHTVSGQHGKQKHKEVTGLVAAGREAVRGSVHNGFFIYKVQRTRMSAH